MQFFSFLLHYFIKFSKKKKIKINNIIIAIIFLLYFVVVVVEINDDDKNGVNVIINYLLIFKLLKNKINFYCDLNIILFIY